MGNDSADVKPPAPEDPRYAVSVAMTFSESGRAVAAKPEPAPKAAVGEKEAAATADETGDAALNDTVEASGWSSTEDEEAGDAGDATEVRVAASVESEPASERAPSEPVVEEAASEPVMEEAASERAPSEPVVEEAASEPVVEEAASERAPSEPVVEEVASESANGVAASEPASERAPSEPVVEEAESEPVAESAQGELVAKTVAAQTDAAPADDFSIDVALADEPAASEDVAEPEEAAPALPSFLPRRMPRARTEVLSDYDLEEMMEPVEDGDATVVRGDDADSEDSFDLDSRQTAQFLPVEHPDDEPTEIVVKAPVSDDEPKPGAHDPASANGAAASSVIAVPADAADSGELISDDAVEEVEDIDGALEEAAGAEAAGESKPAGDSGPPAVGARTKAEPTAAATPPVPPSPPSATARASAPKPPPVQVTAANPASARVRGTKPWFEEVFDEDYLRTLPFLTPQSTQFEANFVLDALGLEPGQQVLDVGCGYGRHAMELAARGVHVVGLDSSLPLLLRGADEAQRRGLSINFVHGDMRELAFDAQFDGAYCLFSTFGYFDDEVNKKTAQNIARALKPGARMVIEILNRDYLIDDLPARVWWEGDGCVVLEEVDFNYFSSRIVSNRSVVFDDGRQLEQEISLRAYSLHELGKLLHAAGFRVLEISGSMTTRGRFFGAKARDIVVVAERPEELSG